MSDKAASSDPTSVIVKDTEIYKCTIRHIYKV